jgi:F1F0 ATPase subunit 2
MIVFAALLGVGLGLLYFGGLRLTTSRILRPHARWWLPALSFGCRLALVAATLWALSREGVGPLLSGLAGLLLARGYLLRRWGGQGQEPVRRPC